MEVVFDLKDTGLSYKTATNLAIYPRNRIEDVNRFAKLYGVNIKKKFTWKVNPSWKGKNQPNTPFPIGPEGIIVKDALTTFIDLQGPVSKKLMKDMLPFCRSLEDREKVAAFTKLGDKSFDTEVVKKNLGVIDLFTVLPSLKLSTEFILQKFPTIMPRYYTIASSSLAHPTDLSMAISLDEWKLPNGTTRQGLVSAFLQDM